MDLTFAATGEIEGNHLRGVVHVFGTRTVRDGVTHEFSPTAFDDTLAKGEVFAFYAHDQSKPLASLASGSLRLAVKGNRLTYDMDLGGQSYAQDLRANVSAGLMTHMSFGVNPKAWDIRDGVRLHTKSDLFDVSPVTIPAFDKTSAQLHAASAEWAHSQAVRARARVQEAFR
jgi:HK97 family phage prohead protease